MKGWVFLHSVLFYFIVVAGAIKMGSGIVPPLLCAAIHLVPGCILYLLIRKDRREREENRYLGFMPIFGFFFLIHYVSDKIKNRVP